MLYALQMACSANPPLPLKPMTRSPSFHSLSSQDLKLQKVYSFSEEVMGLPTVALPVDDKIWMGSFRLDRLVNFDK